MGTDTDALAFTARLGRALASQGAPAHRLEAVLHWLAHDMGWEGTVAVTPTMLIMQLDSDEAHLIRIERVHRSEIDLTRLAALDRLFNQVAAGEISVADGLPEIDRILEAKAPYGPRLSWLAHVLAAAGTAPFFGGAQSEVLLAGAGGAVLGALCLASSRLPRLANLREPLGAFLVATTICLLAPLVGGVDVDRAILAGIIVLVPGFTIATGVSELVSRHTLAGVARLGMASISSGMLAFGVLFGLSLGDVLVGPTVPTAVGDLPGWSLWLSLPAAAVSISIFFRAPARDWGWIIGACALTWSSLEWAGGYMRSELAVFVGAFALGLVSNLYARHFDRPAGIIRMPGLLFLVPGALGFLSFRSLMEGQGIEAITAAGQMAMVAMALVMGMVLAGTMLPPRKAL